MRKITKIILGVVTVGPLLYAAVTIALVFLFRTGGEVSQGSPSASFSNIISFRLLNFLMLLLFVLPIIYIMNVFKNDRVAKDKKTLWAVVLFLGNMLAMPVYWYLYIWREPEETTENEPPRES